MSDLDDNVANNNDDIIDDVKAPSTANSKAAAPAESPKSAFRQSLEMTHSSDAKDAADDDAKAAVDSGITDSLNSHSCNKSLLRQSMSTTILTSTERTFLESLLALEGDVADILCGEARKRLDSEVFSNTNSGGSLVQGGLPNVFGVCDGGEMCLTDAGIPGHYWHTDRKGRLHGKNRWQCKGEEGIHGSLGPEDWVSDWVARGDVSDGEARSSLPESNAEESSNLEKATGSCNGKENVEDNELAKAIPHSRERTDKIRDRQPSLLQQNTLAYKRRQSSSGNDSTTRLFRVHEVGLVISKQGSARRSLARLGIDAAVVGGQPTPAGVASAAVQRGQSENSNNAMINETPTERSIRKLEKRERSKEKHRQHALEDLDILSSRTENNVISPFTTNFLRNIYASKQFSFKRSSSSYSRYDSLLNDSNAMGESFMVGVDEGADVDPEDCMVESRTDSTVMSSDTSSQQHRVAAAQCKDIFRPSPTVRRLNSLLVHAGFTEQIPRNTRLVEADDDVLSLDHSLKKLLKNGGPSFTEENVFRDGDDEEEKHDMKPDDVETGGKDVMNASLISSLGSTFAPSLNSSRDEEAVNDGNLNLQASDSTNNSEVGELPPPSSTRNSLHKRNSTISIMKSSSSSSFKKNQYRRSVSWGHMVIKESNHSPGKTDRSESELTVSTGISVITFPNLRRATPLRSDSIESVASSFASLRLAAPLRSESMSSMASALSSGIPTLSRAHSIFSPRNSIELRRIPSLHRAMRLPSESTNTLCTEMEDDYSAYSYENDDNRVRTFSDGAAWASPFLPRMWLPHRYSSLSRQPSAASLTGKNILIRQASQNNYDGEGIEVDEVDHSVSLRSARNFKSILSMGGGDSVISMRSRSSRSIPMHSLDDSFIVRNVDFERHSSEILRSLSNEDLYSSHHVETIGGASSVARLCGDLMEGDSKSWDLQDENSFAIPQNAWGVFDDEYAEEYGAYNALSFQIIGTSAGDVSCHPHVLSPPLMESLQNFLPTGIAENNFWLKYSLVRDGASLTSLLRQVRGAQHTIIAVETVDGEVFGCFACSRWRKAWNYYGNSEAFLWRMRRTRAAKDAQRSIIDQAKLESELDIFFWTGKNDLVQLCTHDMLAVGGGAVLSYEDERRCNLPDEEHDVSPPQCDGVSTQVDVGGFGLAIDAALLYGTSSPCATFSSPALSREHPDGSPFEIVNLEVWTTTPCMNEQDAEQLEMKKLFLEPYSCTS